VCLNGSFLALFQLEGFALVRRRHGCGGRKGCYVRRVTSNPRAMYTRGGRNKGHHPFPPSLREDLRDALEILVPRLLRVPRESRCLAGNESQNWVEERSARGMGARVGSGYLAAHNHGLLVAGPMRRGAIFALSGWSWGLPLP